MSQDTADPVAPPDPDPRLTRGRVLREALVLIDAGGFPALTIRGLAAALGVRSMSLYRYARSKDALLTAVVDLVGGDLHDDPQEAIRSGDWKAFLVRVAQETRRVALDHPEVFAAISTKTRPVGRLRPPLADPAWAETFFTVLRVCGLSDQEAVAAYRRLSSFLLGHLTIEVLSAVGSSRPNIATRAPGVRGFRLSSSPISGDAASAGVGWCPALTDSGFAEEFDRGLDHLLAGMPARRLVKHPRRLTVGEHGD